MARRSAGYSTGSGEVVSLFMGPAPGRRVVLGRGGWLARVLVAGVRRTDDRVWLALGAAGSAGGKCCDREWVSESSR